MRWGKQSFLLIFAETAELGTFFFGHTQTVSASNGKARLFLKTSLDENFKPKFEFVPASTVTVGTGGTVIPHLAAGDADGDRKCDLYWDNTLLTFNASSNKFEQMTGSGDLFSYWSSLPNLHDVIMGDVTGDGKDDMVYFPGVGHIEIYYYSGGQYMRSIQKLVNDSMNETGCLPNVDNDSLILRDTGQRELLFTDPQVIAVLASPPYYEGRNDEGDGGTSFGYSKSSGTTSSNSHGFSVGFSIGYEYDIPIVGGGAEFEASVKTRATPMVPGTTS
jgi:hypothetical protein